jgi:hypothetical protein
MQTNPMKKAFLFLTIFISCAIMAQDQYAWSDIAPVAVR